MKVSKRGIVQLVLFCRSVFTMEMLPNALETENPSQYWLKTRKMYFEVLKCPSLNRVAAVPPRGQEWRMSRSEPACWEAEQWSGNVGLALAAFLV